MTKFRTINVSFLFCFFCSIASVAACMSAPSNLRKSDTLNGQPWKIVAGDIPVPSVGVFCNTYNLCRILPLWICVCLFVCLSVFVCLFGLLQEIFLFHLLECFATHIISVESFPCGSVFLHQILTILYWLLPIHLIVISMDYRVSSLFGFSLSNPQMPPWIVALSLCIHIGASLGS